MGTSWACCSRTAQPAASLNPVPNNLYWRPSVTPHLPLPVSCCISITPINKGRKAHTNIFKNMKTKKEKEKKRKITNHLRS